MVTSQNLIIGIDKYGYTDTDTDDIYRYRYRVLALRCSR